MRISDWSSDVCSSDLAQAISCVVICIPSCRRLDKFSRRERPSGSLPAFAWDDVALRLNPYPSHYRPAFAFSTFLYPHHQQHSLRSACPEGRSYGLTVFHLIPKLGLCCASSPAALNILELPLLKWLSCH